jgi:hypothetical protein
VCSPRNLIQGLGLDGTVGNVLKHENWIKKRWMDAVKEDSYQILKWRNWEVKAQDRDEWRSRIKKAKALFGL